MRSTRPFILAALTLIFGCGDRGTTAGPTAPAAPASISVTPPSLTLTALGDTAHLTATVLDQDGQSMQEVAVVWASSDGSVATVDAGGQVTAVWNGSATITASIQGGGPSGSAQVTVAQEVAAVRLTPAADTLRALGDTTRLTGRALDANDHMVREAVLSWSSSDASVVSVDAFGLVTAAGNGRATVTAESGEAAGSAELTVEQQATAVQISPADTTLYALGDTVRLTASGIDANGNAVGEDAERFSWRSTEETVATVNASGLVAAVGSGRATIRATGELSGTSAAAEVTVAQRVTEIRLSPTPDTLRALGDTVRLSASATDANGRAVEGTVIAWSSGDTTVARVDATGLVTAAGNGTTGISAVSGDAAAQVGVTVAQRAVGMRVTPSADTLRAVGDTLRIAAAVVDANGHPLAATGSALRWSSSDPSVARVDGTGLVTAVAEGRTDITVRSGSTGFAGTAAVWVYTPGQRDILIAFYNATNGPHWVRRDNWLTNAPLGSWHGVATDGQGRVTGLDLRGNGLIGHLPPELGDLANLERLVLHENGLTGSLPPELGDLRRLRWLELGQNPLAGSIPPELGALSELQGLRLDFARLSGPIPPALGRLTNMQELDLSLNSLSGEIPLELASLSQLRRLSLSVNQLSGPIPPELGQLAHLTQLDLNTNALTGPIPSQLANLSQLRGLYMVENRLVGSIPPELGNLQNLVSLALDYNQLTGPIPPELGRTRLEQLRLKDNELTGSIPPELGNLDLWYLDLQDNQLTGSIPPELGNLTNASSLILSHNPISGPIPPELGNLTNVRELWLWNMNLTGPVPPELGNLTNLCCLSLQRNNLTGPIPPELARLSKLESLHLHTNEGLTGGIPPELGRLDRLRYLSVFDTGLSGRLPQELAGLVLVYFAWGGTGLCSPGNPVFQAWLNSIPDRRTLPGPRRGGLCLEDGLIKLYEAAGGTGWGNDTNWVTGAPLSAWHGVTADAAGNVTELDLRGNGLVGTIPAELGILAQLERLDLRDNRLTGSVPGELGELESLRELYLTGNELSGRLPAELGELGELQALHVALNRFGGALPSSLTQLSRLTDFQWDASGLCAPAAEWFQSWLGAIASQSGGGTCSSTLRLAVPAAHVVQAAQDLPGTVPLIAGREGLLRVFATADQANEHRPRARATFYAGGREIHRADMQLESGQGIPESVDQGSVQQSFNAQIPGGVLTPGVEVVVEVDPEGAVPRSAGSATRLPARGRMRLDVRHARRWDLTVVPVLEAPAPDSSVLDWVAGMGPGHPVIDLVTTVLPVGSYTVRVREPYVFPRVLEDYGAWREMNSDMRLLRLLDGGRGTIYGAVSNRRGGVIGVGSLNVASGVARPWTMAHELGHTMRLRHTSCGFLIPAPDPEYPHRGGEIGVWGYDARGDSLIAPSTFDLMGYCSPQWISDYHFTRALEGRIERGSVAPPVAGTERSRTLLLWGGASPEGDLQLDPAFVLDATAKLPAGGGPYRLEGYGAGGALAFSFDFAMDELSHGGGNFLFAIPVDEAWRDSLRQIVLTGPEGTAVLDEDGREPVALVLDRETGQLRSVLRGQDAAAALTTAAADAAGPGRTPPDTRTLVSFGLPGRGPPD